LVDGVIGGRTLLAAGIVATLDEHTELFPAIGALVVLHHHRELVPGGALHTGRDRGGYHFHGLTLARRALKDLDGITCTDTIADTPEATEITRRQSSGRRQGNAGPFGSRAVWSGQVGTGLWTAAGSVRAVANAYVALTFTIYSG
jgi:hypothetical protein